MDGTYVEMYCLWLCICSPKFSQHFTACPFTASSLATLERTCVASLAKPKF